MMYWLLVIPTFFMTPTHCKCDKNIVIYLVIVMNTFSLNIYVISNDIFGMIVTNLRNPELT